MSQHVQRPNVSLTTNIRGAVKEIMDFPPSFSLPLFRKVHPDCLPTPMEMKLDIEEILSYAALS